jgi:cysteine desulfurase
MLRRTANNFSINHILTKFYSDVIDRISLKNGNNDLSISLNKTVKGDKTLFFDFQSTTPLDPRVLDSMMPYFTSHYGNPHSKSHTYGWEAERATEKAREVYNFIIKQIANLIKADSKEIIFTSGATESNNTALKGVAEFYKERKKHIITTQTVIFN